MVSRVTLSKIHVTRLSLSQFWRNAQIERSKVEEERLLHPCLHPKRSCLHVNGKRVKMVPHAMSSKAHVMNKQLRSQWVLRNAHQEVLIHQGKLSQRKLSPKVALIKHAPGKKAKMAPHVTSSKAHVMIQSLKSLLMLLNAQLEWLTHRGMLSHQRHSLNRNFYQHANGKRVKMVPHVTSSKALVMRQRLKSQWALKNAHQEWSIHRGELRHQNLSPNTQLSQEVHQRIQLPLQSAHITGVKTVLHATRLSHHAKNPEKSHNSRDAQLETLYHLEEPMLHLPPRKKRLRRRKRKKPRLKLNLPNTQLSQEAHQRIQLPLQSAHITGVKTVLHATRLSHHAKNPEKSHNSRDAQLETLFHLEELMPLKLPRKSIFQTWLLLLNQQPSQKLNLFKLSPRELLRPPQLRMIRK